LGLSGKAIEAEYTITKPQIRSTDTTANKVWSKPIHPAVERLRSA
jgi:hypothetical protein